MTINAILAHDENFGIGNKGTLPWEHNSEDMKWFRECTNGHVIIMGRKTWESLGSKKLSNRINIVVSRSTVHGNPDSVYYGEINQLLKMIKDQYPDLKIWIIGGADLYRQSFNLCDNIYVTNIPGKYQCDTFIADYRQNRIELVKKNQSDLSFSIWRKI